MTMFVAACGTTVPVTRHFPDVPAELQVACPELKETPQGTEKLSEVIAIVADNYATYHECQITVDSWIEWYKEQKKIFDSVK